MYGNLLDALHTETQETMETDERESRVDLDKENKGQRRRKAPEPYWIAKNGAEVVNEDEDDIMGQPEETITKKTGYTKGAATNKKAKKATKSMAKENPEEDDLLGGEPVKKKTRKPNAGKKKAAEVVEDVVVEDKVQVIEDMPKEDSLQVISDDVEDEKEEDDGLDFLDDVKTPAAVRSNKTVAPSPFNEKIELERQLSESQRSYKALEKKYNTLQEMGIKKAEERYQDLKLSSSNQYKAYEDVIARLKEQLEKKDLSVAKVEIDKELARVKEETETCLAEQRREMEEEFAQKEATAKEKLLDSANMVSFLQKEIETLRGQMKELKIQRGHQAVEAEGEIEDLQERLGLFEDLTGLHVLSIDEELDERELSDDEDGEGTTQWLRVFYLQQSGKNGDMDFILKVPKDAEKEDAATVTYVPLFSGLNTELAQNLPSDFPEYLQEEIEFDRSMASLFYCRLSNYMKSSNL